MNKQRVLSNKLISEGSAVAKMQKIHKTQQLIVKKKQQIKDIKEKLTPKFADILYSIDENKSRTMTLDVSSPNFKLVKQLARLYWIRAIKRNGTKLTFKKTKLGKNILKDIKPSKSNKYSNALVISMIQVMVGGMISLLGIPIIFSDALVGLTILILGLFIAVLSIKTESASINKIDKNTNDLTVSNCTSVAAKILSPSDLKCEHSILIKYAKQNHKD